MERFPLTNLPVREWASVEDSPLTRYEAVKIWLDSFELVNIILPLFVRDLPGVVVTAGLTLDLIGGCRRGHSSYRRVFLWIMIHISFALIWNTTWCIITHTTSVCRAETTGLPGPMRDAWLEGCWRVGCLQWSWPSSPGSEEASERTTFPRQEPHLERWHRVSLKTTNPSLSIEKGQITWHLLCSLNSHICKCQWTPVKYSNQDVEERKPGCCELSPVGPYWPWGYLFVALWTVSTPLRLLRPPAACLHSPRCAAACVSAMSEGTWGGTGEGRPPGTSVRAGDACR